MRYAPLLLAPLLAACGREEEDETARREPAPAVQTTELTGLYEAGSQAGRSQMCMIATAPGEAAFGLVIETPDASCSGAGVATRTNDLLRLAMTGDQQCLIEAQIRQTQVTFPARLPAGCAYYCAPGATLGGESFRKTGGSKADAMRATDLAGDPLCG